MGSLLRRRGEVEKAVSVHENILRHAVLERSTMLSVQLELARDYMQAGLLDRAEATVESLVDEPGQIRTEALSILLEVYEREKEWDKAIAAAGEIRSVEPNLPHRVSHYYCELAEVGLGGGDADLALRCLRQARDHDATNARVLLLEGRAELERGHHDKARHPLTAILEVDPRRVPESLDLLRAAFAAADEEASRGVEAWLSSTMKLDHGSGGGSASSSGCWAEGVPPVVDGVLSQLPYSSDRSAPLAERAEGALPIGDSPALQ